jgi:hypothetical protein
MTWSSNLSRIRRFLRDPNGNIWSDALIKNQFNFVQKDLQRKTNFLDDVRPVHIPPRYDYAYLQDWEWPFLNSPTGNYQALRFHQQAEMVFCHRWEPQAVWGLVDATAEDAGTHFTQPWEAFMGVTPGDIVPLQYPPGFHNAKFVAWDKEPIDFITLKQIQQDDTSWATRTGEPFAYWRPSKLEDQFCLYPIPSSVVWEEEITITPEADYLYSFSFESTDAYMTGTGENFTREDSTDSIQYLFDWELDIGDRNDQATMRGMWLFERDSGDGTYAYGQVIFISGYTADSETGTIADISDLIVGGDAGIVTDVIEADNNVLFVHSKTPADISDMADESDWPDYLQKYAEYGALEACYAADTDGQIQSLRDYWKLRYDMGIKAIERFKSLRRQDRDYRLVTRGAPGFRTRREPRLPDSYPAVMR